jgi:hypothetical protein
MLHLETNQAHTAQDKEVYSERVEELELENQELHEIVQQMRVDMENMAIEQNTQESALPPLPPSELREKLDLALAELQIMAKEKAQLVDMSNSLRASIRKPDVTSVGVQVAFAGVFPALFKLSKETKIPFNQSYKTNENQKLKMKVTTDQFRKSLSKTKPVRNYNDRE